MNKVKWMFTGLLLVSLIQGCGTGELEVETSQAKPEDKTPSELVCPEIKPASKPVSKPASTPADIQIKNEKRSSSWNFTVDGECYRLSPHPGVKMKSIKVSEDSETRKTTIMTSVPFTKTDVVLTQEVTGVKGFPGLFFRIRQKNVGKTPVSRRIENYLTMKESKYFTKNGEHGAGQPWRKKTGIQNWIYLPDGKKGFGVILNYSKTGMSFLSNLGRKGLDGKRINEPSKSLWGIRRIMDLKPGETGELRFALVAANSPAETKKLCERIQNEKIFPALKLEKVLNVAENNKNTKKVKVEPILNPAKYSAEKTDEKTIEEWVRKEIRPEQFDIWYGQKDRKYLNGSWKFIKLAGTENSPNCNYGIEHGFQSQGFNDKDWFNQPVPFFWNVAFNPNLDLKFRRFLVFSGVGWYRKKFTVPEKTPGKRLILCFQGVDQEATVYVNGKEVASHKTINIDAAMGLFRTQQEDFEADITDIVNYGAENTIAVKVYDNGWFKSKMYKQLKKYRSGIGGIWQEVYLESRPEIYLKKAFCSFNVEKSLMTVDAFVVNTEKEQVKEKLALELSPWKSARYSLAKGKSQRHDLGEQSLKPGMNRLRFEIKVADPQLWSPETPFLYAMKVENPKGTILGMERIGLREFRTGERYFYLNGKKITLRGQQAAWSSWMSAPGFWVLADNMGLMNRRGAIEKWFDMYKSVNHNIVRNHSTVYPHSFYDISDEKGVMIYAGHYFEPKLPFFDEEGKITDYYKGKIKETAEEIQRYPSIVLLSMKNEPYDSHLMGEKIDSFKHYFDQVYAEMKKHAPVMQFSACGRPPTEKSLNETGTKPYAYAKNYAKTDFYAVHNYLMCWYDVAFAEDDDWNCGLKKYYESYALDDGPRVMWNTESIISSIPRLVHGYSRELDKKFRPHVHNDMIDRKWFVENWKLIPLAKYANAALERSVPKFGFLDTVLRDRSVYAQADFIKRITELHRRKREYCAGVIGNNSQIFRGGQKTSDMGSVFNEPVAIAGRRANQAVLACLDEKWDRNIFSGKNSPTPLYLMNDHENEITNAEILISLNPLDKKASSIPLKSVSLGRLAPAEMKTVSYLFAVPENIASGHYKVVLRTKYTYKGEVKESSNDYKIYILNRENIKLGAVSENKIALLSSEDSALKETSEMLKKLNVTFTILKDIKNIGNFQIVILPPNNSVVSPEIIKWVNAGGKLISFSQKIVPEGLPQKIRATGRYGFFTELILKTHPVLKGLEQSDFRYWSGSRDSILNKWVVKNCLLPLNDGVIACLITSGNRIGMSIAEYRLGKGLCLLSQVEAVKRFNTDSVATKYLLNVFDYCLGEWSAPDAPLMMPDTGKKLAAFDVDPKKAFAIDISKECTMGFTDEKKGDQKGGWTDQGPELDLHNMPTGKQVFNGVPFNIIKPAENNGKSCIVLRGPLRSKTGFLPLKKRIKINKKASKLYFLISGAWINSKKKDVVATLKIYEKPDGSEQMSLFPIDLIPGKNISDWWNAAAHKPSEAEMGWVGLTGQGLKTYEVGSYIIEWTNPTPKKIIQYIDFSSKEVGVPVLIGITGVRP